MIPMEACVERRLYRLHSRNLRTGVWASEHKGFIGVREKFGHRYPSIEYHWETGAPFGTARPEEDLGVDLPPEIPLTTSFKTEDGWRDNVALKEWLDGQQSPTTTPDGAAADRESDGSPARDGADA
jgi:hypothetical protein